jgi:hypothetical protein
LDKKLYYQSVGQNTALSVCCSKYFIINVLDKIVYYQSVGQDTVLSFYCTMCGNTGGKKKLPALKILRLCDRPSGKSRTEDKAAVE